MTNLLNFDMCSSYTSKITWIFPDGYKFEKVCFNNERVRFDNTKLKIDEVEWRVFRNSERF